MNHHSSIFVENSEIISHTAYPGAQYRLKLRAPKIAKTAKPGQFIHIQCDGPISLRRPLSILNACVENESVDILYKVVGIGTQQLSRYTHSETLNILGPIGKPFDLNNLKGLPLLLGGGVGMPPMIFLAKQMAITGAVKPLVILSSEVPFPFQKTISSQQIPGINQQINQSMADLEHLDILSRLATQQGYQGCFQGYITQLTDTWLNSLDQNQLSEVVVYACGPEPMLKATVALAKKYAIPCQLSLEEYMACGVGGCAGCVVKIDTKKGPVMKRVCVDGPVFNGYSVISLNQ